jgi:hypothetical protein
MTLFSTLTSFEEASSKGVGYSVRSRSFKAVLSGTDKQKDNHNAEHFDGSGVLREIVRVLSKRCNTGDQHRERDQGGGRPEKKSEDHQYTAGELG